MIKEYKHLFFDLDHTLWDFETNSQTVIYQLFDEYINVKNLSTSKEDFFLKFSIHNETLWQKYRNGQLKQDDLRWKRFWNTLLEYKIADEKLAKNLSKNYVQLLPFQNKLLPNAIEVLEYCHQKKYTLHIITNGFEEVQILKMKNAGILEYFSEIITSEKSMSMKPHKEIFQYALQSSKSNIEESIMIGDSYEADILGAKNFGMDQIYYNPSFNNNDQSATFTIKCLSELKQIL